MPTSKQINTSLYLNNKRKNLKVKKYVNNTKDILQYFRTWPKNCNQDNIYSTPASLKREIKAPWNFIYKQVG